MKVLPTNSEVRQEQNSNLLQCRRTIPSRRHHIKHLNIYPSPYSSGTFSTSLRSSKAKRVPATCGCGSQRKYRKMSCMALTTWHRTYFRHVTFHARFTQAIPLSKTDGDSQKHSTNQRRRSASNVFNKSMATL